MNKNSNNLTLLNDNISSLDEENKNLTERIDNYRKKLEQSNNDVDNKQSVMINLQILLQDKEKELKLAIGKLNLQQSINKTLKHDLNETETTNDNTNKNIIERRAQIAKLISNNKKNNKNIDLLNTKINNVNTQNNNIKEQKEKYNTLY